MRASATFRGCLVSLVLALGFDAAPALAEQVVFARHLALSPDGKTLAFSWAGDIWTVSASGGAARRLTVNPAHDSHPVWSGDGRLIAFSSNRHGAGNVFVMTSEGTDIRRLTFSDRPEIPTDFSPDGKDVYYYAHKTGEVRWEPGIYRVPTAGGQSWRVIEAFGSHARLSPDGKHFAFARGVSKWWRTGYRGSGNWDIWLHELGAGAFTRLTNFDGTDLLPVWDGRGEGVYFLSDRVGRHNVWYQALNGGSPRQVTHISGERVRDFTVAGDGKTLAYTRWDKIYVMTLPRGEPWEVVVTASTDSPTNAVELKSFTKEASESKASPDGKEVALVMRGEIFVIKSEPDKPTRRVTDSPARDWQATWSPDGKALYFVSDHEGQEDVFRATSAEDPAKALSDSLRFKIERVTDDPETEFHPLVSPDGKQVSFIRGRGDLYVRDLKSGTERCLFEAWTTPTVRWSPDSQWIAYAVEDEEYNSDIWIVPADGGSAAVNISQHPDYDGNPQWSADGQVLAFASRRAGMDTDLYMVFLSPELHEKSSVDLDGYFEKASEAAKKRKPVKEAVASGKIVLGTAAERQTQSAGIRTQSPSGGPDDRKLGEAVEAQETAGTEEPTIKGRLRKWLKNFLEEPKKKGKEEEAEEETVKYAYELPTAYRRLRRVTSLPVDQSRFALAPAGDLIVFSSRHEGSARLFSVKWNGKDRKRIMSAGVRRLHWTLDGKRLFYLRDGVPGSCSPSGKEAKTHDFRAKMTIVHREEAAQKFDDAARMIGRRFYHPTLKDLDWPALTAKYRELALCTHTYTEFNEVFNLLQGELNGSHLGIDGPVGRSVERVGYLGCEFDQAYPGPGLKVSEVTARCPADREESQLYPGDVLLRVNGQQVGPDGALDRALIDTVGDQTIVEYIASPERPKQEEASEEAEDDEATGGPEAAAEETRPGDGGADSEEPAIAELVIRPISYDSFAQKRYDAWVEANRRYVEEKSNGRIAYTHIRGMGESQFHVFERDLYAVADGKEGLIIDVRNNSGGWTADWVLAVLSVRRHAYTVGRGGMPGYPQDRLIFYAWTKPATMMCNHCSYSNAEIVSHAFKSLGRGPLVGTRTFGAVISTGGYRLLDGTRVRMPFRGWYALPGGVDMENNGAVPTVPVDCTPADEQQGLRPQLDAAVRATLAQLE